MKKIRPRTSRAKKIAQRRLAAFVLAPAATFRWPTRPDLLCGDRKSLGEYLCLVLVFTAWLRLRTTPPSPRKRVRGRLEGQKDFGLAILEHLKTFVEESWVLRALEAIG